MILMLSYVVSFFFFLFSHFSANPLAQRFTFLSFISSVHMLPFALLELLRIWGPVVMLTLRLLGSGGQRVGRKRYRGRHFARIILHNAPASPGGGMLLSPPDGYGGRDPRRFRPGEARRALRGVAASGWELEEGGWRCGSDSPKGLCWLTWAALPAFRMTHPRSSDIEPEAARLRRGHFSSLHSGSRRATESSHLPGRSGGVSQMGQLAHQQTHARVVRLQVCVTCQCWSGMGCAEHFGRPPSSPPQAASAH